MDMVVHAFNPNTWEAEAARSMSSRLACFTTELVPGQSGYTEKPCIKKVLIYINKIAGS